MHAWDSKRGFLSKDASYSLLSCFKSCRFQDHGQVRTLIWILTKRNTSKYKEMFWKRKLKAKICKRNKQLQKQ